MWLYNSPAKQDNKLSQNEIQTDHLFPARRQILVLIYKKQKTSYLVVREILAYYRKTKNASEHKSNNDTNYSWCT